MLIDNLSTPSLLVEERRLARNIERMQERADANDVALRPHTKTHKSFAIARRQKTAGSRGLTVAKPAEAEAFFDAGFNDIRLAYTVVGRGKHERLQALREEGARISFCVDTAEGARAASKVYAEAGSEPVEVLLEIDVGQGRCGVRWDDEKRLIVLAKRVEELPGLRLAGILTHAGQAYFGPQEEGETPAESLERVSEDERDRMLAVAACLHEGGIEAAAPGEFEISIGSTPTMAAFENAERDGFSITEIRPGNYVFYDAMQASLGSCSLEDCALTVLATVISKHRDRAGGERLYLDAGKKVTTSDQGYGTDGYGTLLYNAAAMRPLPHAKIKALSEEHGWVEVSGGATFGVGDRVRVVPNHACVTVSTQDELVLVDGEDVVERLPVDARSAIQ